MAGIGADGHPPEHPADAKPALKPLNIWRPSRFLQWTEPPDSHLLLPAYVSKGELTSFIGQGGLGKTRLALWLAIDQILQRPWCGLDTGGEPQKWLLLGDENSVIRYKTDLERILSNLTEGERKKVDEFLRLQAILDADDADLNLGDRKTLERVRLTIESLIPGCIIADPLVNFAPGDISKPGK
jgi:RecA-family ATPase